MNSLLIKNATENYLKNLSLEIPHNKLIIVTGISGSGKSSLIYDVIATEGIRLFYDHFLPAGRSVRLKSQKASVDRIEGLRTVVVVNQNSVVRNNRSTVGTLTEIYDFLRLLFARRAKSELKGLHQNRSLFSFNTSYGQCPHCKGLGVLDKISPELIVGDASKSLKDGALVLTTPNNYIVYSQVTMDELEKVCQAEGFSVNTPFQDLTEEQQNVIWYGSEKVKVLFGKHTLESRLKWTGMVAKPRDEGYYKGIINVMEEILKRDRNPNILRFAKTVKCHHCEGTRLNENALSYYWKGKTIADFTVMTIEDLDNYFLNTTGLDSAESEIANAILKKTIVLKDLGLSYLDLQRESPSLSGGEAQRIKLANQVTGNLQNVLYILDEPGSGLHPSEQEKLLKVLKMLVAGGNTVIMTGHDESIISKVDHIIDIGPGAANDGGEILFNGSVKEFLSSAPERSVTSRFISDDRSKLIKQAKSVPDIHFNELIKNNLKKIDIGLCTSGLNIIAGVSGAGKSSLIAEIISRLQISKELNSFSKIIHIDQKPIGRSPKSNPATYTGLSNHIRDLMAAQIKSKELGLTKSHFSFVAKGGRCEECSGAGYIQVGMHFLGNVEILCEKCNGKRFKDKVLEVEYQSKNIYEILEMTVDEAHEPISDEKKIVRYTSWLQKLGLGYIKLGQSSTTLSGGEAQRIKLATELVKNTGKNCLYVLDEPATGLHAADTNMLADALQNLCDNSHTVLCSSHEPRFILRADHIIELGPGSGLNGGNLVYEGNIIQMIEEQDSLTSNALEAFVNNQQIDDKKKYQIENKASSNIEFKSIRTNKLKEIDFTVPHNEISLVCGVSGSGKSSLIFDTVYAECKNRQLDGMSGYIRQFIGKEGKPEFESAKGLMPAVALKKKSAGHNPRSTIGTYTGIYDLYRLLFSRTSNLNGIKSKLLSTAFSFNHEDGACPKCNGLGYITVADPDKFVTNPEKSLLEGAMDGNKIAKFYGNPVDRFVAILQTVGNEKDIDFSKPYKELNKSEQKLAMYGCGNELFDVKWKYKRGSVSGIHELKSKWIGFGGLITDEYNRKHTGNKADSFLPIMQNIPCSDCNSHRIKFEHLKYRIHNINIGELADLDSVNALRWFNDNTFDSVAMTIIDQITQILRALEKSGIGYLPISRITSTLSGGEFQRLQIAGLLKSSLTGILYVLDEPSFGLGSRDVEKISGIIEELNLNGNTVLMNEHSTKMLDIADNLSVMGPGAGSNGGKIKSGINKYEYFDTLKEIALPQKYNSVLEDYSVKVYSANANNLNGIDIEFPYNQFSVITGESGSGKTSLLQYVINDSIIAQKPVLCTDIIINEKINQFIFTEQDVIGSSVLSIPATKLEMFDFIRKLFAKSQDAIHFGFKAAHFTYHSKSGQCPDCKGTGIQKTSMDYWADSEVICETCNGKRYKEDVLNAKVNSCNISDVLNMSFKEFTDWLNGIPNIKLPEKFVRVLNLLESIGIDYLSLGQSLNTLSTGELQFLKLVSGLSSLSDNALIMLDEPTGGLHPADRLRLIKLLKELMMHGHTIICATHDQMLIDFANKIVVLE